MSDGSLVKEALRGRDVGDGRDLVCDLMLLKTGLTGCTCSASGMLFSGSSSTDVCIWYTARRKYGMCASVCSSELM